MNPYRTPRVGPARIPVLPAPRAEETEAVETTSASLRLFDPIDSWGGEWGISAKEFSAALDSLPDNTTEIRVLINSPGGEAFEAIAMANMLRAHPAKVTAVVQGIAASSASFIAAAADELVMAKNSELFIHNGWNIAIGNAEEMRKMADHLDHLDKNIASFYSEKAGHGIRHWLDVMAADTYMSAQEAVDSGLADRIEGEVDPSTAKARFDLSSFARWRDHEPRSQVLPDSTEPGSPQRKESVVDLDAFLADLRDRLGVTDADASYEALLEALDAKLAEKPAAKAPEGVVMIDAEQLASLRADSEAGRTALGEIAKARREAKVEAAVKDGRISNANRDKWLARLEKDEDSATEFLAELEPNTHPVTPIGEVPVETGDEALYSLWVGTDKEGDD